MMRRSRKLAAALLLTLCCALAGALGASAQQSPFQGLPPVTPEQTTTTTSTPTTTSTDSGLETWQATLIVIGGLALLGGIGLAIARDARDKAPVDDPARATTGRADSHQHAQAAKVQARRKGKAAKAARRRNR